MAMTFESNELYKKIKGKKIGYQEEIHCPLILEIMNDCKKGTMSAFCKEARISETTFYKWVNTHDLFRECYGIGKMLARENWEDMGRNFDHTVIIGSGFEYWRMIGWSRFGVAKNSRIRLHLKAKDSPSEHYSQLLSQASEGDFTAGEIKQLMEAINVGLNAHQVFELQNEINALKSDLAKMNEIKHGENTYTNKGIT